MFLEVISEYHIPLSNILPAQPIVIFILLQQLGTSIFLCLIPVMMLTAWLMFAMTQCAIARPSLSLTTQAGKDENKCHGVGGDYWVMHRDTAVNNVKDFCNQGLKSIE